MGKVILNNMFMRQREMYQEYFEMVYSMWEKKGWFGVKQVG